jgi:D-citramalate synthase
MRRIEIMDTTLRDGEQTSGVHFSSFEKLSLAKVLLIDLKVDRIEAASALVSPEEKETVRKICSWAKENDFLDRIEVLGFVNEKSVDWINDAGCRVMNLLCKGSLNHLEKQLGKSREEHISDIKRIVDYANSLGIIVNVYLEDWSSGVRDSFSYVEFMVRELGRLNVKRIMLPDTLGIMYPSKVYDAVLRMKGISVKPLDFHGHNDYGLAVINSLEAVRAGVDCVHTTINGLGERAGNASLDEVVVGLRDYLGIDAGIDEKRLIEVSRMVERFSGVKIPSNKPISGGNVFTQTAGIHADGDRKGKLYQTKLSPERFGRKRSYSLGKLMGKASLDYNLKEMGIELDEESKKIILDYIVKLGEKKKFVTSSDIPYIIADVLNRPVEKRFKVKRCVITSVLDLPPSAVIEVCFDGKCYSESATGDGGYDAFMNALSKITDKLGIKIPELIDYEVSIPPGGKTAALVETIITWKDKDREFRTIGVDSDQVMAAVKATEKMLNYQ